ncbi:MAG: Na/Pi cotransporter family protein [Desulfobacterales bacterium]|nr:Na/Pi cotransporter family protein [Desulfobacterales bacterium]
MVQDYFKALKLFVLSLFISIVSAPVIQAAENSSNEISWFFLIISLLGGLSFFLYGMGKMSEGMKKSAGNKMRSILAAITKNRVIGLLVGAFVTMVIQSSSATTVMLVSFVQAELMTFTQSLSLILGAGIGTTITAQLIAFKLTDYALLMVAVGFFMSMFSKSDNMKNVGNVLLGFGILFFGMKLMSDAMKPLRTYPDFINLMKGLENPVMGIMAGAALTALIQSSSAFTGILIVLGQQSLISLEAAIPMIFGTNIGTCFTAVLASMGTGREAKRVALSHVIFRIAGVLMFVFWIPAFADMIREVAAWFGSGTARQIANAHTFFNVSLALLFLPLTTVFAAFIMKIFPNKREIDGIKPLPWHLDETKIPTPALAIDLARAETSRMAKLLGRMLTAIIIPFTSEELPQDAIYPQISLIEGIEMREKKINYLESKIEEYLFNVARQPGVSEKQVCEIYSIISIVKDMESIGDIIHRNMLPMIERKKQLVSNFSDEGKEEILIYHRKARKQIRLLMEAFAEKDTRRAKIIMAGERKYLDLAYQYRTHHLDRILHRKKESMDTHTVHMELMNMMKQIIVYSSNIAKTFLEGCHE